MSYRGYLGDHEILITGGEGAGGAGEERVTAASQQQQPVMVKTIELKERVNKDKVKIRSVNEQEMYVLLISLLFRQSFLYKSDAYHPYYRYPFRSTSRPRLKHKINLQMEKAEGEES